MRAYHYERIAELERQLLLTPPQVRERHADRLEALAQSLKPDGTYSYEFVYFRVTGFRPAKAAMEGCKGAELREDVLRLLARVSQSAPTPVTDVPGPVLTVQQVAQRAGVCVRTVHRWRRTGLASRKYVYPDGRRRSGIRQGALESFLEKHHEGEARPRRFSRLTEEERRDLLDRARELASGQKLSLTAAARRIARATGRAAETVRRVLTGHDRAKPREALFGPRRGPVQDDEVRRIHEAYRAGQSLLAICARFRLSRASIYRLLNEARARALLAGASTLEGLFEEEGFSSKGAEEALAPERDALPGVATMKPQEERRLLRLYNYLKFQIARQTARVNPRRYVPAGLLDEIEVLLAAVKVVRARMIAEHLPLVIRIARQHAGGLVGLPDLLSESMPCLVRAMDSFDYRREAAFGPYAAWALMREFARTVPEEQYESASGPVPVPAEAAPELRAPLAPIRQGLADVLAGTDAELRGVVRSRFAVEVVQPDDLFAHLQPLLEGESDTGHGGPGRAGRP